MNELPRQVLVQLVQKHGKAIAEDSRLCRGLLNDALRNEHRKEMNVLVHAVEAKVVSDLLTVTAAIPRPVLIGRLVQKLRDEKGTGETEAHWAVETWLLAFGMIADKQAGETKLIQFVREALDRTPGMLTQDDTAAANEMCKLHRIDKERAKQIVEEVREQWHKAHPPKQERKPGEIITNSLGMKFSWIPPGTFLMGSPKEEKQREDNETQHKVTLTKGFYMGVYTVTQEQYETVMGKNPSRFKGEKNLPVEQVSWEDCQEFIKKLREKDKKPYRLPTEAEWEYACRAGTKTPFHFGETISTDQVNYNGNFTYGDGKKGVFRKKTTPVGSFPANAWGLHDMHGNVLQWCEEWFADYPQKDVTDPQGAEKGQYRVLRGGSWFLNPQSCRSAGRDRVVPGGRGSNIGCRLCFCLD